ncbi:MAG: proline--tRNA ligase [Candidatus Omnitrophica bacterium]|nr:proline--tRNA ligase [Candidatus Omnitrophota bacterium]
MLWSKSFIPTLKEAPKEAESESHKLMLRAGLVRMLMGGVYSYLPLGLRCLNNIENIIRQEMNAAGSQELLLPVLQPLELWLKTGRDKTIGDVMFRITDRRGRKVSLGPTHEEVITEVARGFVSSYKQLPFILYQIQTKFRDEIRPRFGLVRCCEFIMKDAYSFDRDEAGLDRNYKLMLAAYKNIFKRCGLNFITTEADTGVMGGSESHEFMVPAESGEDVVEGKNALEVGHIFKLGTKYSEAIGAHFLDEDGKSKPIVMGCYGIGVSRMISAILEQNHDKDGIVWPDEVAPFKALIVAVDATDSAIMKFCGSLYEGLGREGIECLFDDRDERAGVKFKDADLIGIPLSVIVGKSYKESGKVDIKDRRSHKSISVADKEAANRVREILDGKSGIT